MKTRSITFRLAFWLWGISAGVLLTLSAFDFVRLKRELESELQARGQQILGRLVINLAAPIYALDDAQVTQGLRSEMSDLAVIQISAHEKGNSDRLISTLQRAADGSLSEKSGTNAQAQALAIASAPVVREGKSIGSVEVGLSRQPMLAKLRSATITILVRTVVTGVAIVFAVIFIMRRVLIRPLASITTQLNDAASEVASAASQISNSSQSLAEGASEQAASLEETSASLEEMASLTKRTTENAKKVNELGREARVAADTGAAEMQAMALAMNEIKTSSHEIAKIIKTIDEIAFQTNILALNAAVEAARAGEAGMGFAVVADEVRSLAQRAAQASKETAGKIESAVSKTTQGVNISEKVAKSLGEIVTKARQVDELAAEVATVSREQSQGIGQVNTAVSQMDKVTQSNAANAEESASASQELSAQTAAMKHAVSDLLRMVNGTAPGETIVNAPKAQGKGAKATEPGAAQANLIMEYGAGRGSVVRGRGEVLAAKGGSCHTIETCTFDPVPASRSA